VTQSYVRFIEPRRATLFYQDNDYSEFIVSYRKDDYGKDNFKHIKLVYYYEECHHNINVSNSINKKYNFYVLMNEEIVDVYKTIKKINQIRKILC